MSKAVRHALVVVNPVAGGSPLLVADGVVDQLTRASVRAVQVSTVQRGEAVHYVAEAIERANRHDEALDLVVAVGGDGTVREVAEGIVRGANRWPGDLRAKELGAREAPALFVAPAGTGNSFSRALFADMAVPAALAMILANGHPGARVRLIDIGRLVERDQAVVLGASAGFLASVLEAASVPSDLAGRQRYEQAAIELMGRPDELGTPVRVTVDDQLLVEGRFLLVALGGARHRSGSFELLPRSVLDDGLLDVCAIAMTPASRFAELLLCVVNGTHVHEPEVTYVQGRRVTIEAVTDQPAQVEVDGDVLDGWPSTERAMTFEVLHRSLPAWTLEPAPAG